MNAQVFYLKNQEQESLCNEIVFLLKKDVFENESIYIDRCPISENYSKASPSPEHELCSTYVKLLKASMITMTDDFPIVVSDNDGNWCYMGGALSGSGKLEGAIFLQLFHKSMALAFPAVAIMDRMIMLPKGIHEALSGGNFQWLLKPLEVGGAILVDFRDPVSRGEGARLLGSRLQTEIGKLCRRHMLANKSSRPDFEKLAELLKIDKKYFEQHQNEILASMVMLTPKIVSGSAQLAKSSLVTLDIQNESGTVLEGVRVLVRVPGKLEPVVKKTFNFPAHGEGTQRIEFPVSPKALPFCPLEVRFEISEASQAYVPFSIPLLLEVSSPT